MGQDKKEKLEEKRKSILEELKKPGNPVLLVDGAHCTDVKYADPADIDYLYIAMVIPGSIVRLEEKGIIEIPDQLADVKKRYEYVFPEKRKMTRYEDTPSDDRIIFEASQDRLEDILSSKHRMFDRKGNAIFHTEEGEIRIPFTPRELARLGIHYAEFEWEPKVVTKRDIVKASKGLPGKVVKKAGEILAGIVKGKGNRDDDR